MKLPQYLLGAAEEYQDWIDRGSADIAKKYWYNVQQYLQRQWPGNYESHWDQENLKIRLVFRNPAAETWFWLQNL
jgi:hypothetical protein